jgi:hypothetical protein
MNKTIDDLIADVRRRADAWKIEEITALSAKDSDRAAQCRGKANVLEQLANDLTLNREAA